MNATVTSLPHSQRQVIAALKNVSLTLSNGAGTVNILQGIDLDVEAGRSVAIVGPSGSGKTSMLMVLAGLEKPTSGAVEIGGTDLSALSADRLAKLRGRDVGIIFQSFHLVPTMTAIENVALPLELLGRRDAFETAENLLTKVGLENRTGHFPAELSGGEQQRVAIARALAPGPKLVLADEPTGNLDAKTGTQIADLIFELQAEHDMTLVLITHEAPLANRCDTVCSIHDGRISSTHSGQDTVPARSGAETSTGR